MAKQRAIKLVKSQTGILWETKTGPRNSLLYYPLDRFSKLETSQETTEPLGQKSELVSWFSPLRGKPQNQSLPPALVGQRTSFEDSNKHVARGCTRGRWGSHAAAGWLRRVLETQTAGRGRLDQGRNQSKKIGSCCRTSAQVFTRSAVNVDGHNPAMSIRASLLSPEELAQNVCLSPATLAIGDPGQGSSLHKIGPPNLVSEGPC